MDPIHWKRAKKKQSLRKQDITIQLRVNVREKFRVSMTTGKVRVRMTEAKSPSKDDGSKSHDGSKSPSKDDGLVRIEHGHIFMSRISDTSTDSEGVSEDDGFVLFERAKPVISGNSETDSESDSNADGVVRNERTHKYMRRMSETTSDSEGPSLYV